MRKRGDVNPQDLWQIADTGWEGWLFHSRAAATGNALSPIVDRLVRRTTRDVDEAERSRRLA